MLFQKAGLFILIFKNFLNGEVKKSGDPEGRGKAGIELLLLNGIDRLSGNPYF